VFKVKVIQGQGQILIYQEEGIVPRDIVSKLEVNPFTNKEVIANVKVFGRND
jgi:hypothetical protein